MRALVLLATLTATSSLAHAECKVALDPSVLPPQALADDYLASIAGLPAVDKPDDIIASEKGSAKLAAAAAARSRIATSKTVKADRKLAADTYEKLIADDHNRANADRDAWLIDDALVLAASGDAKKARDRSQVVLKDYPDSKYVPVAYALGGDILAHAGKVDDAELHYKKALSYTSSTVYPYALYQEGYVDVFGKKFQDALEAFFKVIHVKPDPALTAAARAGFVVAYAEIGKVDKAMPAFQRVDSKNTLDMLEQLALAYERKQAVEKATFTYETLGREWPQADHACAWKDRLAALKRSPP